MNKTCYARLFTELMRHDINDMPLFKFYPISGWQMLEISSDEGIHEYVGITTDLMGYL